MVSFLVLLGVLFAMVTRRLNSFATAFNQPIGEWDTSVVTTMVPHQQCKWGNEANQGSSLLAFSSGVGVAAQ